MKGEKSKRSGEEKIIRMGGRGTIMRIQKKDESDGNRNIQKYVYLSEVVIYNNQCDVGL